MTKILSVYILILSAFSPAIVLADITGIASVIDGDTIEIHGERIRLIRLIGIDAPESRQLCQDSDGKDWRCGQKASLALSDYIGRKSVRCEGNKRDRYKRMLAVCYLGETDLNGWMVEQGWALAYRRQFCKL